MTPAEAVEKRDRYSRKEVREIIQSALAQIESETDTQLYKELKKLEEHIESMRSELAQLRSIEISHNHIPAASDELDAVVEETAQATGSIMDACEKIQTLSDKLPDQADKDAMLDQITLIFEACSFQDITGQRISKVVRTLKSIEGKVHDIVKAIGSKFGDMAEAPKKEEEGEKSLLNGPQLQGGGSTQEEIDALLASFD